MDAQIVSKKRLKSGLYLNDQLQAGLTVLDTKTGEIVAVGGGRNYRMDWNFAREAPTGSTNQTYYVLRPCN